MTPFEVRIGVFIVFAIVALIIYREDCINSHKLMRESIRMNRLIDDFKQEHAIGEAAEHE